MNFFLFLFLISAFEIIEDIKMLSWCKQWEEQIVLRANSHHVANIIHIFEQIHTVQRSLPFSLANHASKHRNSCCFTSTIVTKQHKDLVLVHLKIDALHSLETIIIDLLQVSNFKNSSITFKLI